MAGSIRLQHLMARGNQRQSRLHFFERSKRVARTVDEQCRRREFGKVRGAKLFRLARRMQGIRKQQQPFNQVRLFSDQHRGLAAAIGVSTCKDSSRSFLFYDFNCATDPLSISLCGCGKWGSKWTLVAERQIKTQNREPAVSKCSGKRSQQIRLE